MRKYARREVGATHAIRRGWMAPPPRQRQPVQTRVLPSQGHLTRTARLVNGRESAKVSYLFTNSCLLRDSNCKNAAASFPVSAPGATTQYHKFTRIKPPQAISKERRRENNPFAVRLLAGRRRSHGTSTEEGHRGTWNRTVGSCGKNALVLGSLALSHPAALIAARPRTVRATRLTTEKAVLPISKHPMHPDVADLTLSKA